MREVVGSKENFIGMRGALRVRLPGNHSRENQMKHVFCSAVAVAMIASSLFAFQKSAPGGLTSDLNENLKIGGQLDFQFYDAQAERRLGVNGATQFRIRRFRLNVGVEMIEDFYFRSTLTMDPVVRDQDEGSVDIDEAYFRFGNIGRNLFNLEDPSHTYLKVGNFFRWERGFFERRHETYSLAGTAFYRDEITGLQIGGDFEEGFFYRFSFSNGQALATRDTGDNLTGGSPFIHDNEQRGDANNSKEVSFGLGMRGRMEAPDIGYKIAVAARFGRLSATDKNYLTTNVAAFDGTGKQRRLGILAGIDYDDPSFSLGMDTELWFSDDGNGQREIFSLAPWVKLKLDGVYYQQRKFFTGVGLGYRASYAHLKDGFANPASTASAAARALVDDRLQHTLTLWTDITQNVDMRIEMSTVEEGQFDVANTEWFVQWSVRF